jgi:DNA processing protein
MNGEEAPTRSAPFDIEPGFYEPARLWFYGNVRLLHRPLGYVEGASGPATHSPDDLDKLAAEAEAIVLEGKVLVCGIHNATQQRVAVVPLRWGSPRIVVMPGGFRYHMGKDLYEEPFRAARLWRYRWDPQTDLAVSRRAPDKLPTFAHFNPSVDRLIALLANSEWPGLFSPVDTLTAILA